ncbi:ATP-binding protein [Spongiactinospora sp. TRM90649]|uniref:ATP-binding protein n=1 Tax=Spongiactinospora sp. TRM90649 TaxID=3031114 RepID=UPI0023F9948B|nr:ATP-binding protein [Spongiactinospora sp. TRM90649]MDF5758714.1 ATP-binding protein [Spongiactinospora sp. TRM90649]
MVEQPTSTADCPRQHHWIKFPDLLRSSCCETTTTPLSPQADSVKTARDVTRATLNDWGYDALGDDAALVVSELVTNAVRYALRPPQASAGQITLMLVRVSRHVVLAVADPSDQVPVPKEPDFISENGRGLYIVETYSRDWGWDHLESGGKAVWALFTPEEAAR